MAVNSIFIWPDSIKQVIKVRQHSRYWWENVRRFNELKQNTEKESHVLAVTRIIRWSILFTKSKNIPFTSLISQAHLVGFKLIVVCFCCGTQAVVWSWGRGLLWLRSFQKWPLNRAREAFKGFQIIVWIGHPDQVSVLYSSAGNLEMLQNCTTFASFSPNMCQNTVNYPQSSISVRAKPWDIFLISRIISTKLLLALALSGIYLTQKFLRNFRM